MFTAITDHILPSMCRHVEGVTCQVCQYEQEIPLPFLPEMIFPNNTLTLRANLMPDEIFLQFNAYDALKMVDSTELPDVQVGPSKCWQEARKEMPVRSFEKPFDWTYTSEYKGTVGPSVRVEPTEERIDFEKLKRREAINFYGQMTLYEDELADHGCAEMTVRVRVMPSCYFILCRFYLRVDGVLVRVCETRVFGEKSKPHAIREWSKREALYAQLKPQELKDVLDPNLISQMLPTVATQNDVLYYPEA
ncbi:TIP41-like family protein [Aphelenchoides avenae]|nr:TIP41-like family protein [Aphelenchus avenae]